MRAIHWLFLVSAALFVSGIGFVLAAERTARAAASAAAPAATLRAAQPVATVKQLMTGVIAPASMAIWDSVSTTVSVSGIEEKAPETEEDWDQLATQAALIVESANLLVDPERALDAQDWADMSKAMARAGSEALDEARNHNPDGILRVGDELNQTCDRCHERYSRN